MSITQPSHFRPVPPTIPLRFQVSTKLLQVSVPPLVRGLARGTRPEYEYVPIKHIPMSRTQGVALLPGSKIGDREFMLGRKRARLELNRFVVARHLGKIILFGEAGSLSGHRNKRV